MPTWHLRVRSREGEQAVVSLTADLHAGTSELIGQINGLGYGPMSVEGRPLLGGSDLASLGLRNASVLIEDGGGTALASARLATVEPASVRGSRAGVYLIVLTGGVAGARRRLDPGRHRVGRNAAAEVVVVDDPMVSSMHAAFNIDHEGHITVQDLESTNGVWVEGGRVIDRRTLEPGDVVQIGNSTLLLAKVSAGQLAELSDEAGPTVVFPRHFREACSAGTERLRRPDAPGDFDPGRAGWWRSLTPLLTGVGFAYLTGRWEFLVITALAPFIFAFDLRRQRTKRVRLREAALLVHRRECAEFEHAVKTIRARERAQLRRSSLLGGEAVAHAVLRTQRLWERRPADADFGSVTVGLAALPCQLDAGDDHPVEGRPATWGMPLETSLITTGTLSVRGPRERSRAVLRSLLVSLCVTHSPNDLVVWILTDEFAAVDWVFARWFPHLAEGRVVTTPTTRSEVLAALRRVLDTRTGCASPSPRLPLHLVVVDGLDVDEFDTVAALLGDGAELGVIGLIADDSMMPEGTQSLLTLGWSAADATFVSRHQPTVRRVHTAELCGAAATEAASSLAGLRPVGGPEHPTAGVRLLDLLGLDRADAPSIVERWRERSTSTSAIIGVSRSVPMTLDLVRHGPHGLLSGMSGSGKTELLMTFLTSLCLNNHPDDLSIVVVDFKGGVDHELTARLPHVIALSTNLQIDQFQRTIDLLEAEQRRRQELLRGVAPDLDAYRIARRADPALPPIPRLLVVVDEFGELLANENGRRHLQQLVSVTRIGRALGVHLLLVTQNFEGQLPPQIEANAGLRLCLRVMKAGHSNIVLNSEIAASIAPSAVGRGYARFNGGDLIEFQTARVVGPRPGVRPIGQRLTLATVDPSAGAGFTGRSTASSTTGSTNASTPTEQTDMARIAALLVDAAALTGWRVPAIPWPGELPPTIELADLLGQSSEPGFPIGLTDRPNEQRHTTLRCSNHEHLVLLGGPGSGVSEAMITVATSAAIAAGPDDLHLFGIDLDGGGLNGDGLDRLASLPQCSVVATRDEPLSLRVIEHLRDEVARRKAVNPRGPDGISDDQPADALGVTPPRLLLLVSGADRLVRRGEEQRSALLLPLMGLLAEAHGAGLQIVLGGLHPLADSRLGSMIDRRIVFSLPIDASPAAYGVPRELAAELGPAGRAIDTTEGRLVQFARIAPDPMRVAQVTRRVAARLDDCFPLALRRAPPPAFRRLTWPLPLRNLPPLVPPPGFRLAVPVGAATSNGAVAWIDAGEDGPVFVVTGPPRSGRSTALGSMAALCRHLGMVTVGVAGSGRSPLGAGGALAAHFDIAVGPAGLSETLGQLEHLLEHLDAGAVSSPVLVFVDDAHRISPADLDVSHLAGRPHLVVIAGPIDFVDGRSETRRRLAPHRCGLLLSPASALDGAAVGLGRLNDAARADPRPGKGLLVIAGDPTEVQIADPT